MDCAHSCFLRQRSVIGTIEGVYIPKYILVQNWKLGTLLRFLQVCVVSVLVWTFVYSRPWYYRSPAKGSVIFWSEQKFVENAEDPADLHCRTPEAYEYHWSETWRFRPRGCVQLSNYERAQKLPAFLFFPTYFDEETLETRAGNASCAALEERCAARGTDASFTDGKDELAPRNVQNEPVCSCRVGPVGYFAQRPKGERVGFGFKMAVSVWDPWGRQTLNFSSGSKDPRTKVVVLLNRSNGYEVMKEDTHISIEETFRSLGLSIDDNNTNVQADVRDNSSFPILRMTGLYLTMELTCQNWAAWNEKGSTLNMDELADDIRETLEEAGAICVGKSKVLIDWSSLPQVTHHSFDDASSGEGRLRSRYTYGLRVNFDIEGCFALFEPWGLLTSLSSMFVFLTVPSMIVGFITVYFLGRASSIYFRAVYEPLSITEAFFGWTSRMVVASQSFKRMCSARHEGQPVLTVSDLRDELSQVFAFEIAAKKRNGDASGGLDEDEIEDMALLMAAGMDENKNGVVSLPEFVQFVTNLDFLTLRDMALYFDKKQRIGMLEKVFDDTSVDHTNIHRTRTLRTRYGQNLHLESIADDDRVVKYTVNRAGSALQTLGRKVELLEEKEHELEERELELEQQQSKLKASERHLEEEARNISAAEVQNRTRLSQLTEVVQSLQAKLQVLQLPEGAHMPSAMAHMPSMSTLAAVAPPFQAAAGTILRPISCTAASSSRAMEATDLVDRRPIPSETAPAMSRESTEKIERQASNISLADSATDPPRPAKVAI
eukprot:TRINITY_DN1701_c0_g3_i1.p1 TRINITY_DN1701_c0_g3~~TRINITY_DN1701_c0_g3_i1.p1  ORF type:complete len:774 (-),score=160.13 TRINITY_DN1701_c0_g3_i1:86-2407(-)